MDNLHFLPNNILTRFFKELTKYKNDYISIVFKFYIYIYIYKNYIMHLNVYLLSIMSTLEKMILYLVYIYNCGGVKYGPVT